MYNTGRAHINSIRFAATQHARSQEMPRNPALLLKLSKFQIFQKAEN